MEAYTLNGEKYYYKNGKWLTSSYMTVPSALASQLNKLLVKDVDISGKSVNELIDIIDGAKNGNNIQLALKAVECALKKAKTPEIRKLLPRTTSIYRHIGQSQKVLKSQNSTQENMGKTYTHPHCIHQSLQLTAT